MKIKFNAKTIEITKTFANKATPFSTTSWNVHTNALLIASSSPLMKNWRM